MVYLPWKVHSGMSIIHETYCVAKSLKTAIGALLQFPHEFLIISVKRAKRESQFYSVSI